MVVRYLQSVGMSCQTRHQIEQFTNHPVAKAAGIELRSGFFDWLGTPPLRNARFIDAGLPGFAPGTVVPDRGHAFLTTPGFHAFHAFRVKDATGKRLDIEATFAREAEKFAYQREKFLQTDPAETVFVLGNTQNNLVGEVYDARESDEYRFDSGKIDALQESLERLFAAPCRLIVMSRRDRFDGDPAADPRVGLVPPETSEWKGDDAAWREVLCDKLGLALVPRSRMSA